MRPLALLVLAFLLLPSLAAATPLEDGQAAYERHDDKAALALWMPLAAADNDLAEEKIGELYVRGEGVKQNYPAAMTWFRRAGDQGNVLAQCYIAGLFMDGAGVRRDYEEAYFWLGLALTRAASTAGTLYLARQREVLEAQISPQQAAEANHLAATWHASRSVTARQARDGDEAFNRRDYAAALRLWRPLAEAGNAQAQSGLGRSYAFGHGVPGAPAEGLKWLLLSAAQNDASAMLSLGALSLQGDVPQDLAEAVNWLRAAAGRGDAQAQETLGYLYESGVVYGQDPAAALDCYQKAARQEDPRALEDIGSLYAQGRGVGKAPAAALDWYRKAAGRGNGEAQYFVGLSCGQDFACAIGWYRKAADQGYVPAQLRTGQMYENGQGVKQNYVEAAKWLTLAAAAGDAFAANELRLVSPNLAPRQRAEADRRAGRWSASHDRPAAPAPPRAANGTFLAQAMIFSLLVLTVAAIATLMLFLSKRLRLAGRALRAWLSLLIGFGLAAILHLLRSLHVKLGWLGYLLFVLSLPGSIAGCVAAGECGADGHNVPQRDLPQVNAGIVTMIAVDAAFFTLLSYLALSALARKLRTGKKADTRK